MRVLLFLLLAMAATAAFAADPRIVTVPDQTPPPATAPAPAPRLSQPMIQGLEGPPAAQPGPGQSGTEQAPLFVRVLPEPKTAEQAEAERREQAARAVNERGLTKYTLYLWRATAALAVVAAIQAGLFVWQLVLIRRSVAAAKTSSEVARVGALGTLETVKVLRNAERPYFSPFNPELRNFDKAVRDNDWSKIIEVHLDIQTSERVLALSKATLSHMKSAQEISKERSSRAREKIFRDYPLGQMTNGGRLPPLTFSKSLTLTAKSCLTGKRYSMPMVT